MANVTTTTGGTITVNGAINASSYNSGIYGSHTHNWVGNSPAKQWIKINQDNEIELDNGDRIAVEELVSTFKYLKEEHPNVFADLILKGIIK
ncbi:hypothetical protein XaC1_293 [Xanthomonas phage XaC1]|nr:hypothetical protein XaC1_293 [Xanthomonas phage XaC1]